MFIEKRLIFKRPDEPPEFTEKDLRKGLPTQQVSNETADSLVVIDVREPNFFRKVKGGEFLPGEKTRRTEMLAPGVTIFRDIGLNFYQVRAGDTLIGIRSKLSRIPEFSYLADLSASGLKSFNIDPRVLRVGMFIPLPLKEAPIAQLDDRFFVGYCRAALWEMRGHSPYCERLNQLVKIVSEKEILAAMLAVAKVECGGVLGEFATHRYEPVHGAFSYTLFHVLMTGAGLRARKKLDMTEGQAQHPQNAAKLFLAFLMEKTSGKLGRFLPLDGKFEEFSTMYNGKYWPETNPEYPEKLRKFYIEALKEV